MVRTEYREAAAWARKGQGKVAGGRLQVTGWSSGEAFARIGNCEKPAFVIDRGLGVTFHVNAIQHHTSNRENEGH
jgi:hypothetical protein